MLCFCLCTLSFDSKALHHAGTGTRLCCRPHGQALSPFVVRTRCHDRLRVEMSIALLSLQGKNMTLQLSGSPGRWHADAGGCSCTAEQRPPRGISGIGAGFDLLTLHDPASQQHSQGSQRAFCCRAGGRHRSGLPGGPGRQHAAAGSCSLTQQVSVYRDQACQQSVLP